MSGTTSHRLEDREMNPVDFPNLLLDFFAALTFSQVTISQYPKKCAVCGEPTKGNWLIGYRMGCKEGECIG
jgi:hypothetical protein